MHDNTRYDPGTDLAPLFRRWSRLLWRIGMRPVLDRMLEVNLTTAESMTLRSLQRRPLTVAEVGSLMHLSQSAASRAVDRLVQEGFVRREENPGDRRQKRLTLTGKGREVIDEWDAAFANGLSPLVNALRRDEQEQLKHLLRRMIEAQEPGGRSGNPVGEGDFDGT